MFVTLCPTFSPQLTYPFRKKKKKNSLIAHGIFDLPCLFFRFSHLFFSLVPGVHLDVCRNALPLGYPAKGRATYYSIKLSSYFSLYGRYMTKDSF